MSTNQDIISIKIKNKYMAEICIKTPKPALILNQQTDGLRQVVLFLIRGTTNAQHDCTEILTVLRNWFVVGVPLIEVFDGAG